MKADMKVSQKLVVMVILAIITVAFMTGIFTAKTQPMGYTPPKEKVECQDSSDCLDGQTCISINDQSNFCGCFDDTDCQGTKCINMRCGS